MNVFCLNLGNYFPKHDQSFLVNKMTRSEVYNESEVPRFKSHQTLYCSFTVSKIYFIGPIIKIVMTHRRLLNTISAGRFYFLIIESAYT